MNWIVIVGGKVVFTAANEAAAHAHAEQVVSAGGEAVVAHEVARWSGETTPRRTP